MVHWLRTAFGWLLAVATIANAFLWVACGGSPLNNNPAIDSGADAPPSDAGPLPDVVRQRSCSLGDGGVDPQGVKLVASPTPFALGVTTDGYAIYNDRKFSLIYAVPLQGGIPEQIGPSWDSSSTVVSIAGSVVFYWTGVRDSTKAPTLGQLIVWTAAGRSKTVATSSFLGMMAVHNSGKLIAYSDNATATYPDPDAGADGGTSGVGTTDIYVSASNGTQAVIVANKVPWSVECQPSLSFVGDQLVVASCASAKLPQPAATIRAYRAPWTLGTVLNTQPAYTGIGHDQVRILYQTANFNLVAQNVMSGAPVPVAPNVATAILTNDGKSVVYLLGNGWVVRSSVTLAGSWQLISMGPYADLKGLSSDDKWLIAPKKFDSNPNSPLYGLYDIHLLPNAPNSTSVPLLTSTTGAFLNDWFTTDNAYVIFGANNKPAAYGYYGDFASVPLATPNAAPLTVSNTVWSAYATKGSKTVYNDGYEIVFPSLPTADIQVVDVANPGKRTKLASHADANFYLSPDKTKALYSWAYCADDRAGLYLVDLP